MSTLRTLRFSRISWIFPSVAALLVAQACADRAGECDANSKCTGGTSNAGKGGDAPEAGTENGGSSSGKSGTSGAAGKGGNPTGGMSAGGGGAAGEGGSEAGAGGMPVTPPCGGDCPSATPVCKEATDTCVECLAPSDCTTGVEKKCDTVSNTCVECLASTDCSGPKAAKCNQGACAKCTTNDDCAHVVGKTVCDTTAGECVQCTGKDASACGMDTGTPLVCDSLTRTCTTKKERSAGLCQPCVSDQHCKLGQLCTKETFGAPAQDVGFFCFERQTAASGGDCTLLTNQPYTKPLLNQSSIDGETAAICGLAVSTCPARTQFKSKDCATSLAADDGKCGFAAGKDSKCVAFGPSQFLCTMRCGSDFDCPGTPCDTGVNPAVCALQ